MTEIAPLLFLGGLEDVTNIFVGERNIRNVLSLDTVSPDLSGLGVNHKFIQITDEEESLLLPHLPDLTDWIIEKLDKRQATLVHCRHGVSRSAAVVAATLAKINGCLKIESVLLDIKNKRPQIEPNPGFVRQLQLWLILRFSIDQENTNYRMFQLHHGIFNYKKVNPGNSEYGYKCGKCRKTLFYSQDIIPHDAAWWRVFDSAKVCSRGLSILPVEWIKSSSTGSRLSCGYCKNKLGSLSLEGIVSCPCSTDLPRGIIVNPSRVDKFKVLR